MRHGDRSAAARSIELIGRHLGLFIDKTWKYISYIDDADEYLARIVALVPPTVARWHWPGSVSLCNCTGCTACSGQPVTATGAKHRVVSRWPTSRQCGCRLACGRSWHEVLHIAPAGILRRADEHLVGAYAEQMARYRLALSVQPALDTQGTHPLLVCDNEGRPRAPSPLVRELRSLEVDLIKAGNRFGFSPTARAQLSAPPSEDEVETDAFTQKLAGFTSSRRPSTSEGGGWVSVATQKARRLRCGPPIRTGSPLRHPNGRSALVGGTLLFSIAVL
jgi:phage terminase small subunit